MAFFIGGGKWLLSTKPYQKHTISTCTCNFHAFCYTVLFYYAKSMAEFKKSLHLSKKCTARNCIDGTHRKNVNCIVAFLSFRKRTRNCIDLNLALNLLGGGWDRCHTKYSGISGALLKSVRNLWSSLFWALSTTLRRKSDVDHWSASGNMVHITKIWIWTIRTWQKYTSKSLFLFWELITSQYKQSGRWVGMSDLCLLVKNIK